MDKKIISISLGQTKKVAETLAKQILKSPVRERAVVLALVGELGSGKTSFLQGFARGASIRNKILSPTFVIFKRFAIQSKTFKNLYHFDCYRIEKYEEMLNLGFADIIKNPQNIVAIEWADRIKEFLPKEAMILEFVVLGKNKRQITIKEYSQISTCG